MTFVEWHKPDGTASYLALDGLNTSQERRWLARVLKNWSGLPVGRGYPASAEEADPAEFPQDEN